MRLCYSSAVKLALVLSAVLLSACSSGAAVQQGPSDTLRAYARALEDGRIEEAYRLLSDEAKRSMSPEAFRRAVEDNRADVLEVARAIARPSSDPVVSATVTVPNGDELHLVFEGGRWRIEAAAVDLYGQSTPRQALTGFLRAYERGRFDVVLRYVPEAEKVGSAPAPAPLGEGAGEGELAAAPPQSSFGEPLTAARLRAAWEGPQKEQIERVVQAIKAALPTATIEETGDSAAMAYGPGGTVAFVREHGAWKIKTF